MSNAKPLITWSTSFKTLGATWFTFAALGQIAFIIFILSFYGSRTLFGDFAGWNDKPKITGFEAGDATGNIMFIGHVLLAAVMTGAGLLQLMPALRRRAPVIHRWSGRVFLLVAFYLALGGLWLTWVRGSYLSLPAAISVSLNGILILLFGAYTIRFAVARRIADHQRWAMRLFMVANGVWFLRVGMMGWILLNQGPVGMNQTMSGPADIALTFGSYLIPLAGLELYNIAQKSSSSVFRWSVIVLLCALTAFMLLGILGAIIFMWF